MKKVKVKGRYIIERGRYKIERGRYEIEKGRVCIWTIELRSEPGGGAIDGDEDNRSDELGRLRPIDTIFFLRAVSFVLSDKDKAGKMVIAGLNLGRVMKISPKK